ncbi:MAG: caspase family protein, partial [Pyrinomonadaceae bacterium]
MRIKSLLPLLAASLLTVSALLPPPAHTQQQRRGLGLNQSAPAAGGGYYALVIGNNAYTSLPRLKTAEADARAVAALLKEFYGFETRLLLNATRAQTVSALYAYRRTLGPEANLLIYYAGHGFNDREADKAYWLPVDAVRDDESTWIIADEITTGIRVIPARHVLIVSDSCYSGTLTRGIGESLPPSNAREQFLQRMAAGRSRTLMASGGDEPVADGGGGG